jgi:hypothetical protein
MKRNPFKSTASERNKKSSFGSFVTVNSRSLFANNNKGPSKADCISSSNTDFNLPGCVWESKLAPEECTYSIFLQAKKSFVVVFAEEERLPELAGVLRSLATTVITISLKTQRAQAAKALAAAAGSNSSNEGGFIIMSPQMAVFTESCLPERLYIKCIVHIGVITAADFERRSLSGRKVITAGTRKTVQVTAQSKTASASTALHIHVLTPGSIRLAGDIRRYEFNKSWTSIIQSRVAAARKLHFASIEGKSLSQTRSESSFADFEETKSQQDLDSDKDRRQGVAGKIEALRNKLKILMSIPLPDICDKEDKNSKKKKEDSDLRDEYGKTADRVEKVLKVDSPATLREKMAILGMIAMPSKGGEKHKLAEMGRTLAATRWIDYAPTTFSSPSSGQNATCGECYPWGEVRYGASHDTESLKVTSILNAFREYVSSKAGGRLPKRWEESKNISEKLKMKLKSCRVVGFGWRPHIRGDSEWGGAYGKCCGHNEVVMFYCRPFAPLEVLNTHVCSKASPAPGNDGYDGCLEFMQAQCRWFGRSMTVWDDNYFHFIGPDGVDRPTQKKALLTQSTHKLKALMLNLRRMTAQCEGQIAPNELLRTLDLLLSLANGDAIIDGLKNTLKVHRLICSYLLVGTSNSWSKASK